MAEKEKWKNVIGYEDRYAVSNFGRVRRKACVDARGHQRVETILRPSINASGYFAIRLTNSRTRVSYLVHRLVYETFVGAIPEGYDIHHVNRNRKDNRPANLICMPHGEHSASHTERFATLHRANRRPVAALKNGMVLRKFSSRAAAAEWANASPGGISRAANGKAHTCAGYAWQNIEQTERNEQ